MLRLDRVLAPTVFSSFNDGLVCRHAGVGRRTDRCHPSRGCIGVPRCHVSARPIGGLDLTGEHGFDFKVLCVAVGGPWYERVSRIDDLEPHRSEIEYFFAMYGLLEGKPIEITGWGDCDRVTMVIGEDRARYRREEPGIGS